MAIVRLKMILQQVSVCECKLHHQNLTKMWNRFDDISLASHDQKSMHQNGTHHIDGYHAIKKLILGLNLKSFENESEPLFFTTKVRERKRTALETPRTLKTRFSNKRRGI